MAMEGALMLRKLCPKCPISKAHWKHSSIAAQQVDWVHRQRRAVGELLHILPQALTRHARARQRAFHERFQP